VIRTEPLLARAYGNPTVICRHSINGNTNSDSPDFTRELREEYTSTGPEIVTVPAGTFEVYVLTLENFNLTDSDSEVRQEQRFLAKEIGEVKIVTDDGHVCEMVE
jgi:uncharacterized protein YfaP (DUF2135 family)